MQVVFNNVDRNGNPVGNIPAEFVADENRAKAILESMFFNNITLTFNVGLGFVPGGSDVTGAGAARTNSLTNVLVTYVNPVNPTSGLRNALLTFGQPNFFTAANRPPGDSGPLSPRMYLHI